MIKVLVTLKHEHKIYRFVLDFPHSNEEDIAFIFTEGNYSCDCNRSLFIKRHCDPKFREMGCGEEIDLVNLRIVKLGKELPVDEYDLLSDCCGANFDAFGFKRGDGLWQEACLKCGRECEPVWRRIGC